MAASSLGGTDFSWLPDCTLAQLLERAARHERGVRFLDRREQATFLSYAALLRRARFAAAGLQAAGVGPGDRVALVLPTGPDFFDAFFGSVLAGGIPVPLYPPVRLGRLDEYHQRTAGMLASVQARCLVTDRRVRRILGKTLEATDVPCLVVDSLARGAARPRPLPRAGADDTAFIQMSSGTTRAPNPIRLSHRQVLSNVARILESIVGNYPEDEHFTHAGVSWLPLYHDMGLVGCVLTALARPGDLTLIPPEVFVTQPAVWLRAISRYRGTVSPAPNFAYALCVERIADDELTDVDLSSWRIALNGAEPVTPSVLQRFVDRFSRYGLRPEALTPVYGLAEATLAVTFSDVRERFRRTSFDRESLSTAGVARERPGGLPLVSLGRPLPGYEIRIVDRQNRDLPAGVCGRVLVRGPSLMQGYHDMPLLTRQCLQKGWLNTGDRGFLHDGELYLHGRDKDIIILRGRNYSPQEFEQVLDGVSGVRPGCTAAVGIFDPEADAEVLVMLVERSRTPRPDGEEVARNVRRQLLNLLGVPAHHVAVLEPGTLPRTSSGKIRRSEAKTRYLEGTLTPPKTVTKLRMLGELVQSGLSLARARRAAPQRS